MMVEELLDKPEDEREFGIVAFRESHTLTPKQSSPSDGPDDSSPSDRPAADAELYPVGVSAVIRQAERREDGRYDIVTIGSRRFRIDDVDRSAPLVRASVTFLLEPEIDSYDPRVMAAVQAAMQAFDKYRSILGGRLNETDDNDDDDQVPADPSVLSYLITAALVVDGSTRQKLLAAPDAIARLRLGTRVLSSESALISAFGAIPALDLLNSTPSEN
jgi:Lon protease-like protein